LKLVPEQATGVIGNTPQPLLHGLLLFLGQAIFLLFELACCLFFFLLCLFCLLFLFALLFLLLA
jgi:hypothetical protein